MRKSPLCRIGARLGLCLSVMATVASAAFVPARAETLRAHYSITLLGLPIGTAGLTGVFGPANYRVDVNVRTTGLAGVMLGFRGAATANGGLAAGHVVPAGYAISTTNSEGTRTVRMAIAGGNAKGVDISPPIEERPDRVPLTAADKRGIVDPMSALVMPVPGNAPVLGPAGCNRRLPVFDGYARFDISLAYKGERDVQGRGYSGPVAVCAVRYTPIAGHRVRRSTQYMANNTDMEIWLAPVGTSRLVVPYRIAVRTLIGMAVIEASEFIVDEARKAAIE